jgi:hypothetical protein
MSRPITMISPAGPIPGPTFGPRSSWLEKPVPEYDLEGGQVGERPRWRAIAPYLGIPAASAAIFGLEAFAPTFAVWLGLGGGTAEVDATAAIAGPRIFGSFATPESANPGTTTFGNYAHKEIAKLLQQNIQKRTSFSA